MRSRENTSYSNCSVAMIRR